MGRGAKASAVICLSDIRTRSFFFLSSVSSKEVIVKVHQTKAVLVVAAIVHHVLVDLEREIVVVLLTTSWKF